MKNLCGFLLSLTILALARAETSSVATNKTEVAPPRSFFRNLLADIASPLTTRGLYVLAGGSLITTGFYVRKQTTNYDFFQSEYGEDKPQGTFSKYGDIAGQMVPNALYAGAMIAHSYFANNNLSFDRASLMFRATAYASIFSTIFKGAFDEKRPNGGRHSFPSGHATTAFAFASVVACEHPWYFGIPAFGLATFVGLSRMNDNKHYFHDVLAGATLGAAYGISLYLLKRERQGLSVASTHDSWLLYPVTNLESKGLGFSWNY